MIKVNLGCGQRKQEGYVNVDLWLGSLPDIVADIRYPIPGIQAATVDEVLCHHVLEHLHGDDWRHVMREIQRMLKQGGTFEIRVPHPSHDDAMIQDHKCVLTPRFWQSCRDEKWLGEGLIIDSIEEVANQNAETFVQALGKYLGMAFDEIRFFVRNAYRETSIKGHRS